MGQRRRKDGIRLQGEPSKDVIHCQADKYSATKMKENTRDREAGIRVGPKVNGGPRNSCYEDSSVQSVAPDQNWK